MADSESVGGIENPHVSGGENEMLVKGAVFERQVTMRAEGVDANTMRITKQTNPDMVGQTASPDQILQMFYGD